jgi:hypothetical protein
MHSTVPQFFFPDRHRNRESARSDCRHSVIGHAAGAETEKSEPNFEEILLIRCSLGIPRAGRAMLYLTNGPHGRAHT